MSTNIQSNPSNSVHNHSFKRRCNLPITNTNMLLLIELTIILTFHASIILDIVQRFSNGALDTFIGESIVVGSAD